MYVRHQPRGFIFRYFWKSSHYPHFNRWKLKSKCALSHTASERAPTLTWLQNPCSFLCTANERIYIKSAIIVFRCQVIIKNALWSYYYLVRFLWKRIWTANEPWDCRTEPLYCFLDRIHSIACYMLWILNLKRILQLVQNLTVRKVTLDCSCMLGQGTVNKAIENKRHRRTSGSGKKHWLFKGLGSL